MPREIEARLQLSGGGVDKVYKTKLLVENDSRDSDLKQHLPRSGSRPRTSTWPQVQHLAVGDGAGAGGHARR